MKKISILLLGVAGLFATGCAEDTSITDDDILVSSFYNMGCNDNFDYIIELGKNPSVSGTYPNAITYDLSCNSDTYVTVEFFDMSYAGHYLYFLVNGENPSYSNTISMGGTHSYTFQFNTSLPYDYGTYNAKVRITALNRETRKWTYRDYMIYAVENDINSKEIAVSKFEGRVAPKLNVTAENTEADNDTASNSEDTEAK